MFLVTSTDKVEDNNMTFKDLYDEFRMHNDEIMKDTTKYGYDNKKKFIECFYTLKVKDFHICNFNNGSERYINLIYLLDIKMIFINFLNLF